MAKTPEKIGRYEVLAEIGQGGMSTVYRAHDSNLDREVAIKILHPHLARDPDARERFAREARAVARLTHRNIPEVYDFSATEADTTYLVTEVVDGGSLAALIEGTELLPEFGVMFLVGVADALQHAHGHQIIHRDVKPENILVGEDGVVKLTDFGIAQIVGLESMTITGTLVGSPAHMSPEQIEGIKKLDFRADVWALGTVLYMVITNGALPFDASTPHGVLKRIMDGKYTDPRKLNPHVGSELVGIVNRCLRLDREERFENVSQVATALREWLTSRGIDGIEGELARYMTDPVQAEIDLAERLVTTLLDRATKAMNEGQRHQALEDFGRVLTLDMNNEDALRRVRRLHAGIRVRRAILGVLVLIAIAGVGLAAFEFFDAPPPPQATVRQGKAVPPWIDREVVAAKRTVAPPVAKAKPPKNPPPPVKTLGPGRAVGEAIAEWAPDAAQMALLHQAREKVRISQAKNYSERPATVRLTAEPPAVQMRINGRSIRKGSSIKLRPGKHKATLTHPGCKQCTPTSLTFRVKRFPSKQHKHFRFRYKPTRLRVECPGGKVQVGGKNYGSCGKTLRIRVLSHQPSLKWVTVRLNDGRVRKRRYIIKPGANIVWKVR